MRDVSPPERVHPKLPVLDDSQPGLPRVVQYVDADHAIQMMLDKIAAPLFTKKKIRALKLLAPAAPPETEPASHSDVFKRTKYSHHHETQDNPENVWTLKRLPKTTRPVFLRVLSDVGGVSILERHGPKRVRRRRLRAA